MGSQLDGEVLSPNVSPVFMISVSFEIALCIATRLGLYLMRGNAHCTSSSPACRSWNGYVIARFHCHVQNLLKESAKCNVGSFVLLVQSLIANAPGQVRKLLSDRGRGFRRVWMTSTNPCGDRWAFSVKWINSGSMMRVSPLLLCLMIVCSNTG